MDTVIFKKLLPTKYNNAGESTHFYSLTEVLLCYLRGKKCRSNKFYLQEQVKRNANILYPPAFRSFTCNFKSFVIQHWLNVLTIGKKNLNQCYHYVIGVGTFFCKKSGISN